MTLYRFKTARYTFSVPFATGSILAGKNEPLTDTLFTLGEHFGIIYQLVDDTIGLFGKAKDTGKPVGSDLQEKKQTLLLHYLDRYATAAQKKKIDAILRKDLVTESDIEYIQSAAKESGAVKRLEEAILESRNKAEELLYALPVKEEFKEILGTLLAHGIRRKR